MYPINTFSKAAMKIVKDNITEYHYTLQKCISPLLEKQGGINTTKIVGTSTLFKHKNASYILTASHVIDNLIGSGIILPGDILNNTDFDFKITLAPNGIRKNDKYDFAFSPWSDQYRLKYDLNFYNIDLENNSKSDYQSVIFSLFGFPISTNKNIFYSGTIEASSFTQSVAPQSVFINYPEYSYKNHLLFKCTDFFNEHGKFEKHLNGISGGAVFSHKIYEREPKIGNYDFETFYEGMIIELTSDNKYIVCIKKDVIIRNII